MMTECEHTERVPLILAGSTLIRGAVDTGIGNAAASPRCDYVEIAHRLGAGVFAAPRPSRTVRALLRVMDRAHVDLTESVGAVRAAQRHSLILSFSERTALPVAALLRMTRSRVPHVAIAHKLSSGWKTSLWRLWRLQTSFAQLICLCRSQADFAVEQLAVPAARVHFLLGGVDHRFFHPLDVGTSDYVLAVGREQRDYGTLARALANTGLRVRIVSSGGWSRRDAAVPSGEGITVATGIAYPALRDLYARARLVVVPLHEVDYAAGMTAVLEAMAMGKAVVVTRSTGIADYVAHGETVLTVPAGVPAELRDAILTLLEDAQQRRRLGTNARQAIEEQMNLDVYVERIAGIVRATLATTGAV
jgi:glycosyltransferase involved in cell wall biosynthesis